MVISVLEKVIPAAVKTLGKPVIIELVGLASIGAGGVNFILDKTMGPVVDKGRERAKEAIAKHGEKKKAKLLEKYAAVEALKREAIEQAKKTEDAGKAKGASKFKS